MVAKSWSWMSSYATAGSLLRTNGTASNPLIHSMSWSRRCVFRAYSTLYRVVISSQDYRWWRPLLISLGTASLSREHAQMRSFWSRSLTKYRWESLVCEERCIVALSDCSQDGWTRWETANNSHRQERDCQTSHISQEVYICVLLGQRAACMFIYLSLQFT